MIFLHYLYVFIASNLLFLVCFITGLIVDVIKEEHKIFKNLLIACGIWCIEVGILYLCFITHPYSLSFLTIVHYLFVIATSTIGIHILLQRILIFKSEDATNFPWDEFFVFLVLLLGSILTYPLLPWTTVLNFVI